MGRMTETTPDTPEPPDTSELLTRVRDTFSRYVVFPSAAARDAVTLWAAHTHVAHAFETTPRLAVLSKEPGSGKSRVLEILEHVCPSALLATDLTPAVMWRVIDAGFPTILVDEADTIFGRGGSASAHRELRAIVNAGHRRGASVPRTVGAEGVHSYHVYAPVAMAGLGTLPHTIMTRSIAVHMRRRRHGESIEPYRAKYAVPTLHALRTALDEWSVDASRKLAVADPTMPVEDRDADVWEPLVAIADLAGGDWPARARDACLQLTGGGSTPTPEQELVRDVREHLTAAGGRMHTDALLVALRDAWPTLDARTLAHHLAPHGMAPKLIRQGGQVARGYELPATNVKS